MIFYVLAGRFKEKDLNPPGFYVVPSRPWSQECLPASTQAPYCSEHTESWLRLNELFATLFVGNSEIIALPSISVKLNGAIAIV